MAFKSTLDGKDEYVKAIGMISIENANLEVVFAEMLSVLLNVRRELGQALYLTPKSAIARLEILENVIDVIFKVKGPGYKRIEALIGRAKAVIGKRHNVIHDSWGLDEETKEVARRRLPSDDGEKPKVEPLGTLTDIVRDYRKLITDAWVLVQEVAEARAERQSSRDKTPQPSSEMAAEMKPTPQPDPPKT